MFVTHQAQRQAATEKTVAKEEPKETTAPLQTEPTPDPANSKLPVGRRMSSIHVNYNYFEIGTGQVSVTSHPILHSVLRLITCSVNLVESGWDAVEYMVVLCDVE